MSALPRPVIVENAVLGGLVPNVAPAGIGLIASTLALEHFRASTPEGLRDWLEVSAPDAISAVHIAGDSLWAGPFIDHFGHALAEWIHRLWAASVYPQQWTSIVFQVLPGQPVPLWAPDLFRACGVDPALVSFVGEPTAFERLHVPKQGRVLGGETLIPGYEALFPLAPIPPVRDAAANVYVSRAQHIHTGTYLGEALVEQVLRLHGFRILRPETLPLVEVLSALQPASLIVFAEGSAIHNLELIGRVQARIRVIARRHGARGRFHPLLRSLADSIDYFGAVEPIPLVASRDDGSVASHACSLVPIDELLDWIGAAAGFAIARPSAHEIDRAVAGDLARYLLYPLASHQVSDEHLGQALRRMQRHPALAALAERLAHPF